MLTCFRRLAAERTQSKMTPTQTSIPKLVNRFASDMEAVLRTSIQEAVERESNERLRSALDKISVKLGIIDLLPTNGHGKTGGSASRTGRLRSAKERAHFFLAGRYMGSLRALSAGDKKKVKIERKKNGLRPAIALAQKFKRQAAAQA